MPGLHDVNNDEGEGPPLDVVHLHVGQAMRTMERDRRRAEQLHLITAPLKAWMGGGGCSGNGESAVSSAISSSFGSPPLRQQQQSAMGKVVGEDGPSLI